MSDRPMSDRPVGSRPGAPRVGASRQLDFVKSAFMTTEFWVFVVITIAVLVAAAVVDFGEDGQGFGAATGWLLVTILAAAYMVSRGLAKSGHRRAPRDYDDV
jgi:hypothetical protein